MSKSTLSQSLDLLRSDKVKERQEGFASLEDYFQRLHLVQRFDSEGDGKAWIVVFQAIFEAVSKERYTYLNSAKGALTALNRLAHGVGILRSLCERAAPHLKSKPTKLLLMHALTMMRDGNELMPKVTLDYVKIIRCLLRFPPHLEHLRGDTWLSILARAFNVILGDELKTQLSDNYNSEHEVDIPDEGDSILEDDTAATSASGGPSTKRKRAAPAPRTASRHSVHTHPERDRSLIEVQIEFTSLIAMLLTSSSAPFHLKDHSYLPSATFGRLARFISLYLNDTSLHYDYLQAVLAALSRLAVNNKHVVTSFAVNAWDDLTSLWGSKNKVIKESLINVFKILFPFLTAARNVEDIQSGSSFARKLGQLWTLLDGASDVRWHQEILNIDALRLELLDDVANSYRQPFVAGTFRAGWHFDAAHALAWSALELQADCAAEVISAASTFARLRC